MPSQKNLDLVSQIKTDLQNAKSVVIADYSGLDVAAQNQLRSDISAAGGKFLVTKNRLFKLAASDIVESGQEQLDEVLAGQNGFLFAFEDAVSALKTLFTFAKDHENLEIKLGILDGKVLSFEETKNLSELPSKPELIAKLIGQIQAPLYGLVNVLQGNNRKLVYVLSAIKDQKAQASA